MSDSGRSKLKRFTEKHENVMILNELTNLGERCCSLYPSGNFKMPMPPFGFRLFRQSFRQSSNPGNLLVNRQIHQVLLCIVRLCIFTLQIPPSEGVEGPRSNW